MRRLLVVLVGVGMFVVGACGDGEDRPGQVTSESDGSSGSASGSSTGSASGSSTGSASGHGEHEDTEPAFEASEADTTVDVVLQDFAFVGMPAEIKGPNVLFKASVKTGEHEIEILDADGEPVGEIAAFKPGKTKELAVELEPGTYTAVCHVEEGAKTHEELGMKTTFTVV